MEGDLIQDYINKADLSGACECLSKWQPVPYDSHFRPCPFWKETHIFCPLSLRYRDRWLLKKMRLFDCQSPDIDIIGDKSDVTTAIFCLNKKSHISSTFPDNSMDIGRSNYYFLLSKETVQGTGLESTISKS